MSDDKAKIEELTNNWKRALADYQNLEKNFNQQKANLGLYLKQEILLKFLPILESLEKAHEHLKDQGLELAIKQFKDLLKSEGLEELDVLNKDFDPVTSECTETEAGEKDNIVTKVLAKGYKLAGTVILPAKVIVSKKQ
jgi:molecular chaperone GrpE